MELKVTLLRKMKACCAPHVTKLDCILIGLMDDGTMDTRGKKTRAVRDGVTRRRCMVTY